MRGRPRKVDKLSHAERVRRHSMRYPLRTWARNQLKAAIRRGHMVRPDACSECGIECKPHGHHDDYAQPLNVRWLCGGCHREHHKSELRKAS